MRAIGVLLAVILLFGVAANAQTLQEMMPVGSVLEESEEMGSLSLHKVRIPDTGEVLVIATDAAGQVVLVETKLAAECSAEAEPVQRSRAEELIREVYPDCRILMAQDVAEGKQLTVADTGFCGTIIVADDRIRSRSLEMAEIFKDGTLTMDGALRVLKLLRPDAEFYALELGEEDGFRVYEGEALVDGELYEFELEVTSARLMEWERD